MEGGRCGGSMIKPSKARQIQKYNMSKNIRARLIAGLKTVDWMKVDDL